MEPFPPFPPTPATPSGPEPGGVPAPSPEDLSAGLLDVFGEPEEPEEDWAVDPDASLPGEERTLDLTEEERRKIANYLCDLLVEHDAAYRSRWEREQQIEDAYAMMPDSQRQGPQPNAARLCSELTKSQVDQAKARIVSGIMGVKPLMQVSANDPNSPDSEQAVQIAEASELFLQEYTFQDMRLDVKLPLKVLRACKVGTAVSRDMWTTRKERVCYYDTEGRRREELREVGWLEVALVPNNDVLLWPPDVEDWQDAEMAGHRARLSPGQFRTKCSEVGVDRTLCEDLIEGAWEGQDEHGIARAKRQDVNLSGATSLAQRIRLTEIWYCGFLPDFDEASKYHFFLHEESRSLLYWSYNPLHCQLHPYWPLHYKRIDGSAWGEGVGHELVFMQAAASTLDNLEIDNLKVIANKILVAKEGSQAEALINELAPGARIASENPAEDLVAVEMGGSLDNIYAAKAQNLSRATAATGLSSILQGMGDPTMKSGADASSVALLSQEGGRKFGDVDRTMRQDLGAEYIFFLELLQQFAPNGLFYKRVAKDTAALVETIKYTPPRGRVRDMLRITAQAPSAASNKETAKQNLMIVYNLLLQHLQVIERLGTEVYQQENPAALITLKREILEFINIFFKRILELHEVDGVSPKMPRLHSPTPPEQIINQLMGQLQELGTRLSQLEQSTGPGGMNGAAAPSGVDPGMGGAMGVPAG